MNISKRVYFPNTGNTNATTYAKFQLEQNVDTLEFLSLNVSTKEAYQTFNANYGVLIGRVIANEGIGIPNAKVSVFIPLDDEDTQDDVIKNIYPYKSPRDKDNNGKIYNLLPRVSKQDPKTKKYSPKQPVGSFPVKEEILLNDDVLKVYKKYYKYTTVTNGSGDYMLYGVPIGVQTVHLSVDITDIGEYSMNPSTMITNLGYSQNLFSANDTEIKITSDLDNLPQVDTQEISVDIIPFWGDTENFEIGITRQDFKIRAILINTFTVFGTSFTDKDTAMWGQQFGSADAGMVSELNYLTDRLDTQQNNVDINLKRYGKITEKIYYLPEEITDDQINSAIANQIDMGSWYKLLNPTQYSSYKKNGDFVFVIPCNRNRIYTNEAGVETPVLSLDNNNVGVYSKFRGFITFEISTEEIPHNLQEDLARGTSDSNYYWYKSLRYKFKFPQSASLGQSFTYDEENSTYPTTTATKDWRNQHFTFQSGKIYSVSKFNATIGHNDNYSSGFLNGSNRGFNKYDNINTIKELPYRKVGLILTSGTEFPYNMSHKETSDNDSSKIYRKWFGGNWLNFAIYFPQVGVHFKDLFVWGNDLINPPAETPIYHISSSHYTQNFYLKYYNLTTNSWVDIPNGLFYSYDKKDENKQRIAANDFNTFGFARSDLHWTTFVEVPTADIEAINNSGYKAFISYVGSPTQTTSNNKLYNLTLANYKNGYNYFNVPNGGGLINGGYINNVATSTRDNATYFFTGLDDSNCIKYLIELGLNQ